MDKEAAFTEIVGSTERTSFFWEKSVEQIQSISKYCIFLSLTLFASIFYVLDNKNLWIEENMLFELCLKLSAVCLATSTLSLFLSILRSSEGLVILHTKTFGKLVILDEIFYSLKKGEESKDKGNIFDETYYSDTNEKFIQTFFWANTGIKFLGGSLICASLPFLFILINF